MKTFCVFNDVHVPFHCSGSWKLLLDTLKDIQPDEIYILGDYEDFYSVNMHGPHHPEILQNLESEIHAVERELDKLRELCQNSKIIYNAGNHFWRLERFILDKVPSFYNFFNLKDMYNLERKSIEFVDYQDVITVGKTNLKMMHSPPSYGENGARTSLMKKPNASWIFGCTHRMQCASITDANGVVHRAWFNGHMASTTETQEHKRVFSYAKGHENWQKCFGFGYHDGKHFDYQQSLITQNDNKFSAMVFGNLYEVEV